MSDTATNSSFGPPPVADDGPATSGLLLLVIALLVVLVGAVAMTGAFLAIGGSDEPTAAPPTAPAAQEEPAAPDETDEPAGEAAEPVAALDTVDGYDLDPTRDPFSVIVPVATAPDTTDPDAVPAGTDPADPADPDDPADSADLDAPAPQDPDTAVGCSGDDVVVCDEHLVVLVEVLRRADAATVAIVQVDTTVYEVAAGALFAEQFELLSIDGTCATLRYAQDDVFELCAGERVLK